MEHQPVDRLDFLGILEQVDRLDFLAQVKKQLGLGIRLIHERVQHAGLLADIETVVSWAAGDEQGMLKLHIREGPYHFEGRRRLWRTDDT